MNNIDLLASALSYIEQHLEEKINTNDIAEACYCSKSTLEKLFKCVNDITIRDYLVRRRMTKAARDIAEEHGTSLLFIALRYGYSTNESFSRAFKEVWNCKPSEFRHKRYSELYPRLEVPLEEGDEYMCERKHVDISELYDLFVKRKDCYFVCCDIKGLVPINEISRKAGDLAILESLRRMNEAAGEDDVVFRIGGDEFALLTARSDVQYAEEVADKILSYNEQTFEYEGQKIPLSLFVGIASMNSSVVKYDELFTSLHTQIKATKEKNGTTEPEKICQ